jgi:hypothetical protein
VAYWIPSLFQAIGADYSEPTGLLFGRLISTFNHEFRVFASLIALLFILTNGYLLIQLNTIHIFIPFRTQLPFFFYVLITLSLTQLHQLTPALVSSTLLIGVFFSIFSAYKTDGISVRFLDAGLLISAASLIYFPAVVFFLFLWAGMSILRPFIWREWVFTLFGLILPYVFMISGYFLLDIPVNNFFNDIADALLKVHKDLRLSQIVNWSYILLFTLISSYFIASAIDSMKIHSRKFFLVYLLFFLVSLLGFFVISGAGTGLVYYSAIPLAYLFAYYFVKCRRTWINEVLFAIFILLFLWQRIN